MPMLNYGPVSAGKSLYDDTLRAFRAQPTVAGGLGAVTRESVTGPISYAMSTLDSATRPVRNFAGEFYAGLSGARAATPGVRPAPAVPRGPVSTGLPTANGAAPLEGEVLSPVTRRSVTAVPPEPITSIETQYQRAAGGDPIGNLVGASAALRQIGALNRIQNAYFKASQQARKDNAATALQELDVTDRTETENLRRLAASGDEKALARYRNIQAAKLGKSPDESINEKLLEAYIRSTAEFSKDPNNMGKTAPTFIEFLQGLPPAMFPNVQKAAAGPALPAGAVRQVGTSGGRPVYLMKDGSQKVQVQ